MSIALGINSWVWTSPMSDASAELIYRAKAMGFDAFEVAVEDPAHFAADGAVTRALRETGLKPIVCGAFGPTRDLTHEDERFRRESITYIRGALALAQAWGSTVLAGPVYSAVGKRRQLPDAQRKIEWQRAVVGLREAGKIAADAGVTLAIEPLNRFETDLVNTSAQAVRLVDEVGSMAVKIHLDTFHMHIEEKSLLEAIRLAGPRLAHVHGCENDRGAPGTGLVAWGQVAQGLREIGYSGSVVIESFTPECQAIADAAAIWRPLAATQDALASEGLKFLRGLLR
ncbi:MAG: sugar phosphate isomerase/epimerase [Opitutaceae bacterium]